MRFFKKTINSNDMPEKLAMDKSGADKAAIDQIIKNNDTSIVARQVKYLNNIVEQDYLAVKRIAAYSGEVEHSFRANVNTDFSNA